MSLRFDRDKVFDGLRKWQGPLTSQQVSGLNFILDSMEKDSFLERIEWAAYMLATTKHETANTYQPIHEYGTHARFVRLYGGQTALGKRLGNKTPEDGAIYSGEGDVQLTGKSNYEKSEDALREEYPELVAEFEARTGKTFDLTVGDQPNDADDPKNAGDPAIAYAIMSYGMRTGLFTGRKLADYTKVNGFDSLNARKIINGLDSADTIAGYYKKWLAILRAAFLPDALNDPAPKPGPAPAAVPDTPQEPQAPALDLTSQDPAPAPADKGSSDTPVPVETVAAEPESGIGATVDKWSARYAAIPGAVTAAGAGIWAKLTDSPTDLVLTLTLVAGAIIAIYVIGKHVSSAVKAHAETKLKDAREQRAHEIQLALINAAANKNLNTVQLVPPPATLPNSDPLPGGQEGA